MDIISISDSADESVHDFCKNAPKSDRVFPIEETLSSESTQRCPVTWNNKEKKHNVMKKFIGEMTPCANTKVHSWLEHNIQSNVNEKFEDILSFEGLKGRGRVLIRHDYNKEKTVFGFSAKESGPLQNDYGMQSSDKGEVVICLDSDDNSDKSVIVQQERQTFILSGVPLSPESQKKNELCSYLKLMNMNCTDKRISNSIQNRRSIRVQNLNILSERKKLEKKLLHESKQQTDVTNINRPESHMDLASKSFAELQMNISQVSDKISKEKLENCKVLNIGAIPKRILDKVVDFDEEMKAYISAEKLSIKEVISQNNNHVNNLNEKLRRPKVKYRNLRSNHKLRGITLNKLTLEEVKKKKKTSLLKRKVQKQLSPVLNRNRKIFNSVKLKKKPKPKSSPNKKHKILVQKEITVADKNLYLTVRTSPVPQLQQKDQETVSNHSNKNKERRKSVSSSPKKSILKSEEIKTTLKTVQTFKEKDFCIIDLSHQNNADTLLDHDYATKAETAKNYVMDVIVSQPFINENNQENVAVTIQNQITKLNCPETAITNQNQNEAVRDSPTISEDIRSIFKVNDKPTEETMSKNKAAVIPTQHKPSKISNNNDSTQKNNVFNGKPLADIFKSSDVCSSPITLSTSCLSDIINSLESPLSKEDSPLVAEHTKINYTPFELKSLHKSLIKSKRTLRPQISDSVDHTWDDKNVSDSNKQQSERSHSILISDRDGHILNAFYLDFNLIIVQEQVISFWTQSALGNMLGSQNMWISKGSVQRLVSDGNCIFKKSSQTVISLENSIAYVELCIKEHKSDKRERPVADIFANIYFCWQRFINPDKKVLQLENIKGLASDVQYVVMRNSRDVIVSWYETCGDSRNTYIRCYNLASDYQTVVSVKKMGNVNYSIASLHYIEECDTLIMGYGEHKVTLWNVEYSYVVATIEINDIRSEPNVLWVKCDRGFLFTLQFYELEKMFKLIAISGIHRSWKRLKVFTFPSGYKRLRGVCLDNNILGAFYDNGVICWNIQSGEAVIEEMCSENVYIPSEKHVIILSPNGILVRHALSHFITSYDL